MSDAPTTDEKETYAAVDLGSNSFHLLVARRVHGELRTLDRIKETVRLGAGLDEHGRLDQDTRERAIECLARFGQRLRGISTGNIRAVGTQTLRRMRHANPFLLVAETALGCPVDVIAGREEARLIYLGVSQDVAGADMRNLVIDVGGGSTEIASGVGAEADLLESLQFGCVTVTKRFFADGRLDLERWQRARGTVQAELQEQQLRFREAGWDRAIGSSGSVRAVAAICQAAGWSDRHITLAALEKLRTNMLSCERIAGLAMPGLSDRRQPVLAGGVIVLEACFAALGIESMEVSRFALREGLLYDLLGRLEHRDPRDKTVRAFMSRYEVDPRQAERVRLTARGALGRIADTAGLTTHHREMLDWASLLHETGLGVSHSQYEMHSGYLVEHSDMAGFSRQEQLFLATLVRFHRRAIPRDYADALPQRLRQPLRYLLFCLRFAWILCRTREDGVIPGYSLQLVGDRLTATFPADWTAGRPLTATDLEQEGPALQALDLQFDVRAGPRDPT